MTYHPDRYVREYTDRGMAKWLGFYLSEHTSEMEKDHLSRNIPQIKEEKMTDLEIAQVLETAYIQRGKVSIQLNSLDMDACALDDITGTLEGFESNDLYLSTVAGIDIISIESIHSITLIKQGKWSDIS